MLLNLLTNFIKQLKYYNQNTKTLKFNRIIFFFFCDTPFSPYDLLVRMVFIQRFHNIGDSRDSRPTLLTPPLIATPYLLFDAVIHFNALLKNERLSAIDELLVSAHCCRVYGDIIFCRKQKRKINKMSTI